ncbi:hypothetical protein A2524_00750 [Candidatus Wolfebacteria bacterium RIFOXYD12_FULL_48_21]|uniref:Uncharacterized protein n=1 Tax=Candidatus Wolfebacteria bacterium RIFOXYD1_FULL_48_65 TaxID=1802561 RepID=A0A1F8E1F8_9BACT|nr:MAG: hypothetical protein A2610_02695 [Candidatus Wolfebacteria bacterium RIFOXYD1_FULL_48_65]OGM94341.1 MAG: hypothetical protein A2524_00750 [Candidatus Wolfebacteria bacterium RIFOXYD12_FULL_48_21]OGM96969.1 MAG: hypothetical protein A2532_01480 [Candidatus Wolfebacteria bacterium RIFOXYD2_FULL_48_11]
MFITGPTSTIITGETLLDWQLEWSRHLSTQSVEYLGIAIGVITLLGGGFYFFSLRPLEKGLDEQEKQIENQKKEVERLIKEEIEKAKKDIKALVVESTVKDISIAVSQSRESIEKELNGIRTKLSSLDITRAEQSKEVQSIKKDQGATKTYLRDVDFRLRDLEIYKYSKEGQMGAIYVAIETIKKAIGTLEDWRIPYLLDSLEKEIDGLTLDFDIKNKIGDILSSIENTEHKQLTVKLRGILRESEKK